MNIRILIWYLFLLKEDIDEVLQIEEKGSLVQE
jgi:hypothetical protein